MRRTLLPLLAILLGCEGTPSPIEVPESPEFCEGLDPDHCLLPFPSDRFLKVDPSSETGFRLDLPAEGMPVNAQGRAVDPAPFNRADGFSVTTSMIADLPFRIETQMLPTLREVERSVEDESPTLLLDVTAGTRVLHFAEIESGADADPARSTLYVRPASRLPENHRFVVALRNLTTTDGIPAIAPQPFRALRDRTSTTSASLEARRAQFEQEVFEPLAAAGLNRDSLVLAWAFRTGTERNAYSDLLSMRNDAMSRAGERGLGCSIENVAEDADDPNVFRRIEGTIVVPSYLEPTFALRRDASGTPLFVENVSVPFTMIVPRSAREAAAAGTPSRLVLFEHGLFSSRGEVNTDYLLAQANADPMVLVATDLRGLASGDEAQTALGLVDLNLFTGVIDRLAQSIVATLLLPRTIAGACLDEDALRLDGRPLFDANQRYYYGISQGGNLGPTFAALSDDITRFVMSVGGISYPIMITRSVHWPQLEAILGASYPKRSDRDLMMVMFSHHWDRIEGSTFATHVLSNRLVGGSSRVLFQVGLYDVQTPNEGSHLAARAMNLPQFEGDPDPVFGLPAAPTNPESAYVTFDLGADPVPQSTAPPAADNGVHEGVRRDLRARAQIDAFLKPNGAIADVF